MSRASSTSAASFAKPVLAVLGVVVAGAAVGFLAAGDTNLALALALAVFLFGASAVDLAFIPILALPATLIQTRVGGVLSVSDFVLGAAAGIAVFMLRGRGAIRLQPLVWAGVVYLAVTIPTLLLNPYVDNLIEWAHELFLVLGSMIVGFVLGREGKAPVALTVYVVASALIGVAAVLTALAGFASSGVFTPVFLPELHKNTIGGMLAAAVVIAVARPVWLGWSRRTGYLLAVLCGAGVLAAQSRQGIVGALVGIFIVAARPRLRTVKRWRVVWLVLLGIVAGVLVLGNVNEQLSSDNPFNSANQRLSWYEASLRIWASSPVFGVGMRWWYTDRFPEKFQPPNAELEVLSTTGVVGLVGFLVLFAAATWLLLKMDPVYGTVGVAIIATRFVQAQFDLYWVAGQASLLWIVAGICYGVRERDRALGIDRVALAAAAEPPPTRRVVRPPLRPLAARTPVRSTDGADA